METDIAFLMLYSIIPKTAYKKELKKLSCQSNKFSPRSVAHGLETAS